MSDQELIRDGERWQAFAAASDWADRCKRIACASCESVDASPVRFVDPYTARVEPWYVTGDVRVFVFVCDECAAAGDEYDAGHGFTLDDGMVMHCGEYANGSGDWVECRVCDAVISISDLPGVES
jgi:hypothetical protein